MSEGHSPGAAQLLPQALASAHTSGRLVRMSLAWFGLMLTLTLVSRILPAAVATDESGQGTALFSLLCFGAYDLVFCLLGSLLISGVLGCAMGAIAGLFDGWVDRAMRRLFEVFGALPSVILAVVLAAASPHRTYPLVLALGLTRWVEIARLVRVQVRQARAQDYVTAARALGLSRWAVLRLHIAPNAAGPVVVALSFSASGLVALRMLVGFVLPQATSHWNWGASLRLWQHGDSLLAFAFPALFLIATQLSQSTVAEGLRRALDSSDKAR